MSTLKLIHPVELGKKPITELRFRSHTTAEDYLAFDAYGSVETAIRLIASLTGEDQALIRRLSGADYRRAKAIADKMLGDDAQAEAEAQEEQPKVAELSEAQKKG